MNSQEALVAPNSDYYLFQPSVIASQIYFYPIALGFFHYLPDYVQKRLRYDSFLIMYIEKGSCLVTTQNKLYHASKNEFVIIDCYEPHAYQFPELSDVCWMHFDGPLARTYYDLITSSNGHILNIENFHIQSQQLSNLLSLFRKSEPLKESSLSENITMLLNGFLQSRLVLESPSSSKHAVEKALAYINKHFAEDISLNDIANNVNHSPYYFSRIFTAETGLSPHQYLISTRINSAKFLLTNTNMPVKDIAYSSGFNSESNFCISFRKKEGITPGQYRANNKRYAAT